MNRAISSLLVLLSVVLLAGAFGCSGSGGVLTTPTRASDDDDNDDTAPPDDDDDNDDDTAPPDDDDDNDDDSSPDDDDNDDNDDNNDNDDDNDDNDDNDDDSTPDDDDDNDDDAGETVWADPTSGLVWQNGGNVGLTPYAWADAKSYCANLGWASFHDWRLPDIYELRSLLRGCAATARDGFCGATDACLFESCWNVTCEGCANLGGPGQGGEYWPPQVVGNLAWYWSSSATADSDNKAWDIHFSNGHLNYDDATFTNSARCVRGSAVDDDDDDDNDDDTAEAVWVDVVSGWMWQDGGTTGSTSYNWADAESYCTNLSWGGYTDWQLPDIDALRSLVRGCPYTNAGGSCGVTDTCLSDNCWTIACYGCAYLAGPAPSGAYWPGFIVGDDVAWFWSSSASGDPGYAYGIYFDYALVMDYVATTGGGARCVRSSTDRNQEKIP